MSWVSLGHVYYNICTSTCISYDSIFDIQTTFHTNKQKKLTGIRRLREDRLQGFIHDTCSFCMLCNVLFRFCFVLSNKVIFLHSRYVPVCCYQGLCRKNRHNGELRTVPQGHLGLDDCISNPATLSRLFVKALPKLLQLFDRILI